MADAGTSAGNQATFLEKKEFSNFYDLTDVGLRLADGRMHVFALSRTMTPFQSVSVARLLATVDKIA